MKIKLSDLPEEERKAMEKKIREGKYRLIPNQTADEMEMEQIRDYLGSMTIMPIKLCRYADIKFARELRRLVATVIENEI